MVKRDGASDGPGLAWIGASLDEHPQAAPVAGAGLPFSGSAERIITAGPSVTWTPTNQLSGTWISALGPVSLQISEASGRTTGLSRVRIADRRHSAHQL